jgi:hypothetical protein
MTIARTLFVLGLTTWMGAVAFFSGIVLPMLFTRLEPARAGEIAALLFPAYYRLGLAAGVVLLGAIVFLAVRERGAWRAAALVAGIMLACQAYATFALHPQVAAIRGVAAHHERFEKLHRRSVRLNGVVAIGGLALVLSSGWMLGRR